MKTKKLSIKWSVYLYLLLFAAVILSVLWLCQVVFLDDIYKSVKMSEIKSGAEDITDNIDSPNLGKIIDSVGNKDICVRVADMDKMIYLYSHHSINSCAIHSISDESILTLYRSAEAKGGSCTQRFMYDARTNKYIGIEGEFFDKSQLAQYKGQLPESIIYTAITENKAGTTLLVILNSEITPVAATVDTLNSILIAVTLITVILALALAIIISLRVTKPIIRLTGEAKKLGNEDYNANFNETGYSEVAQLSEALEHAKTELSRVDTLRRQLIANISHDLRTPLTMIGGYAEMMRDIPGENNDENAQIIIDETARLSSLVNDVLDLSRLESGIGKFEPVCFNITDSVRTTLNRFTKLCEKQGYNIEFICDGDAYVISDEKRITQVIYNLLINAMTHTGEDRSVKVRQYINTSHVRIEVSDTGEGIKAEDLPLIWDRYYKVDRVHRRTDMGSGLGLSIIKTIMEQTGGKYGVTSTIGMGSTFFIELERVEMNYDKNQL